MLCSFVLSTIVGRREVRGDVSCFLRLKRVQACQGWYRHSITYEVLCVCVCVRARVCACMRVCVRAQIKILLANKGQIPQTEIKNGNKACFVCLYNRVYKCKHNFCGSGDFCDWFSAFVLYGANVNA